MTDLVGHFIIFGLVAVVLLAIPLIIGWFVRPNLPTPEKVAVYECGEPTIGSSYIQFDLRFYVVALLFIIFDVEVAFFFPWALIYGGATQLADPRITPAAREVITQKLLNVPPSQAVTPISSGAAFRLAALTFFDILVFFAVLLVGFAYVWKRGDLDWVRAVTRKSIFPAEAGTPRVLAPEPLRVPQAVG
ncbi:MAG TPA: NADH-quinone oxidoreductase subunit A [Planctomycetaceae bacterium]|nr:NADH-quinone oxidoreductase subunit A [Planctomycetaceae bacterium]